jgi:hypothetical protein
MQNNNNIPVSLTTYPVADRATRYSLLSGSQHREIFPHASSAAAALNTGLLSRHLGHQWGAIKPCAYAPGILGFAISPSEGVCASQSGARGW